MHDGVRNVVIEGCLYAHNRERNPRLKGGAAAIVRDSVMYNWGSACVGVGARGNQEDARTGGGGARGGTSRSRVRTRRARCS